MNLLKIFLTSLIFSIFMECVSSQPPSIDILFNRTRPRNPLLLTSIATIIPTNNQSSIDELLKINQDTRKDAEVAVQAFANSISACRAYVSCDQANKQYFEVENNLKVAASAWERNKENQKRANSIMNRARDIINMIRNELNNKLENYTKSSIETSVQNTAIAVKATAQALTQCQLVVNVTCSKCPDAPNKTFEFQSPESNRLISEIRENINRSLGFSGLP